MKLIRQPNRWTCNACAFAMALDITLDDIYRMCSHDGSEIINPGLPDPHDRRGFNIMEMILCSTMMQKTATPLMLDVSVEYGQEIFGNIHQVFSMTDLVGRLWRQELFGFHRMVCIVPGDNSMHAVAYNPINRKIYNPNGFIYEMTTEYMVENVFMIK